MILQVLSPLSLDWWFFRAEWTILALSLLSLQYKRQLSTVHHQDNSSFTHFKTVEVKNLNGIIQQNFNLVFIFWICLVNGFLGNLKFHFMFFMVQHLFATLSSTYPFLSVRANVLLSQNHLQVIGQIVALEVSSLPEGMFDY